MENRLAVNVTDNGQLLDSQAFNGKEICHCQINRPGRKFTLTAHSDFKSDQVTILLKG